MGVTVVSAGDSVRALCKRLIADGYDPSAALQVWDGAKPRWLINRIDHPDDRVPLRRKQESAA
jgi:hypothetical protein